MGIDLDVNDSLSLTHPSLNEDSGAPTDSDSEAATETHAPREGHSENATLPTFELSASDGLYHRLQVLTAELGECPKWVRCVVSSIARLNSHAGLTCAHT